MKQGLQLTMAVEFDVDLDTVEQIEFIFRPKSQGAAQKTALYPGDVRRKNDVEDVVLIPWSRAETYQFPAGQAFYMDTRITLKDTTDQPETNIVMLAMEPTLFEE